MPGTFSLFQGHDMSDLSLFLNESGSDNFRDTYYILALVVHGQADALADNIDSYELALREKGLPDIPLHTTPRSTALTPMRGWES